MNPSVSRNLERIRRELRECVEETLRQDVPRGEAMGHDAEANRAAERGLSDAQIALCFEYATEDAPIDFNLLFPSGSGGNTQREAGRKDS